MERCLRNLVVLEEIFKNLPAKELNTCTKVCSLWNQIANSVKHRRNPALYWYFCKNCEDHDCETAFSKFADNLYVESQLSLVFATKGRIVRKRSKSTEKDVKDDTENDTKRKKKTIDASVFLKALPCSQKLFCTSRGITGTTSDCKLTEEIENGKHGISAAYFPHFQGVKIHKFKTSDFRNRRNEANIPPRESLKCLLIFMNSVQCAQDETAISDYINEGNLTFGVGGARVTKVNTTENDTNSLTQGNFVLAFTGNNVRSVSVVIPSEIESAEDVEKILKDLPKTNILNGHCIAFAFTCVARGENFYKNKNIECNVFRKIFPEVPLLGVFANGEIGVTHLPGVPKTSPFIMAGQKEVVFHFYSTVFVIISFTS